MLDNLDAFELWLEVKTQWRASGFGLIGLDYVAVQLEADRLEIDLSRSCMRKIKKLERVELKRQSRETDSRSEGPDKSCKVVKR